jgi:hypothetical protein
MFIWSKHKNNKNKTHSSSSLPKLKTSWHLKIHLFSHYFLCECQNESETWTNLLQPIWLFLFSLNEEKTCFLFSYGYTIILNQYNPFSNLSIFLIHNIRIISLLNAIIRIKKFNPSPNNYFSIAAISTQLLRFDPLPSNVSLKFDIQT